MVNATNMSASTMPNTHAKNSTVNPFDREPCHEVGASPCPKCPLEIGCLEACKFFERMPRNSRLLKHKDMTTFPTHGLINDMVKKYLISHITYEKKKHINI